MTTRFFGFVVLTITLGVAETWVIDGGSPAAQVKKPAGDSQDKKSTGDRRWPPRTPDGQPNVQGVWGNPDGGIFTHALEPFDYLEGLGKPPIPGRPGRVAPRTPPRKTTYIVDPTNGILPHQPWALERRNSVMRHYQRPELWQVDPETLGWPGGIPRIHVYAALDGAAGGPWQIMQGPGYILFLYETQHEYRYVPLDGRPQPGRGITLWMGSSRGRWEGNTLVIESSNHNDSTRFDVVGDFHSDEMQVSERFTYVDKDTIEYRATINDPKVYTRPWTIAFTHKRAPAGAEIMEYAGVEGETAMTRVYQPPAR